MKYVVELAGWYGVIAILAAYGLVSFNMVGVNGIVYQLLNLSGGGSIALISIRKRAFQPATLNIVWALVALVVLVRLLF
jgi:hypothetical protein